MGCGNAGDSVAEAIMGCGDAGDSVAGAIMGCGDAGDSVAGAIMGCGGAGDSVAEAIMGCGSAGDSVAGTSGADDGLPRRTNRSKTNTPSPSAAIVCSPDTGGGMDSIPFFLFEIRRIVLLLRTH